jgi:hypothetical protein
MDAHLVRSLDMLLELQVDKGSVAVTINGVEYSWDHAIREIKKDSHIGRRLYAELINRGLANYHD